MPASDLNHVGPSTFEIEWLKRIGIARAFLKNAPILVLDEATSALDPETEARIQSTQIENIQDRTIVAVAHRLSTLVRFDRIIVVEGGRIVEDGNFSELRKRNGLFAHRLRQQSTARSRISRPRTPLCRN